MTQADECHRAVTPQTKRELERFFKNSLWYGFTGTPIFEENQYEQKGDLSQTTEQLYGECLHSYTIMEAIHDKAVLEFMVETLGPRDLKDDEEEKIFASKAHMREVVNTILNNSISENEEGSGKNPGYVTESRSVLSEKKTSQSCRLIRDRSVPL